MGQLGLFGIKHPHSILVFPAVIKCAGALCCSGSGAHLKFQGGGGEEVAWCCVYNEESQIIWVVSLHLKYLVKRGPDPRRRDGIRLENVW